MGGVVVGRSARPKPVEGGHVAVTVGGLIGALAGASVGWELFPLLAVEGDPNIGAANLAIGLMALVLMVGGGLTVGALVGIGVALRVTGHRGIAATVAASVALAVAVGAFLAELAAPLVVAAPLMAAVPAAARWLVIAVVRRRARGS
jgi:hypothetical protein